MKKALEIISGIGVFLLLVLAFIFKPRTEAALNENKVVMDTVKSNDNTLVQESAKREEIKQEAKKEQDEPQTPNNVVDFFNNRK